MSSTHGFCLQNDADFIMISIIGGSRHCPFSCDYMRSKTLSCLTPDDRKYLTKTYVHDGFTVKVCRIKERMNHAINHSICKKGKRQSFESKTGFWPPAPNICHYHHGFFRIQDKHTKIVAGGGEGAKHVHTDIYIQKHMDTPNLILSIYNCSKNEILHYKYDKMWTELVGWKVQNTDERNHRRSK